MGDPMLPHPYNKGIKNGNHLPYPADMSALHATRLSLLPGGGSTGRWCNDTPHPLLKGGDQKP